MNKLFLDDVRYPDECLQYLPMNSEEIKMYLSEDWVIVRNYSEFVEYISKYGVPDFISFDHDLAKGHYHKNMQEGIIDYDSEDFNLPENKTGMHCVKWLCDYCKTNNKNLPQYKIHSMNPVGRENMKFYLENYVKLNK